MITVDLGSVFLGGCVLFAVFRLSQVLTRMLSGDTITAEQYSGHVYVREEHVEEPEIQQAYTPGYPDDQSEIADVVSVSGKSAEDNLLGEAL